MVDFKVDIAEVSGIRIGIVGPEAIIPVLSRCVKGFPSIEPIIKSYRREEEALTLAISLIEIVDIIIFTGPIPYQMAKNEFVFPIPVFFIPLTGSGLYKSLLKLERQQKIQSLSIDTLDRQTLLPMFQELKEGQLRWTAYEGKALPSRQELIEFHKEQFYSGKAQCALTAVHSVWLQLQKEDIPCEWIIPSELDIIVTLERVLLSSEWRRDKEAQVVLGFITVDNFDELSSKLVTEHEIQKLRLEIGSLILNFVELLDGHMSKLNDKEYFFVTSRGLFERETGGYKRIPLIQKSLYNRGLKLSVGIGFGHTTGKAGRHARQSLRLAQSGGSNICFIVREDKSIIGPLGMSEPMQYNLALVDTELISQVEAVGLTSLYLSKLMAQASHSGRVDYYAQELALILGITVRSVHRLLLAWMDAGIVDIVGEEKGAARGRPRLKYRMTFISKLIR